MLEELKSTYHPQEYPNDINCVWKIYAPEDKLIVINIYPEFDLEEQYDFLTIGEGLDAGEDIVIRLTGFNNLRKFASKGSTMWISFTTDSTGSGIGFRLGISHTSDLEGI